jgi:hypothetical protein
MNDEQIRLSILRQFHDAKYTGQGVPDVRKNPEIAGILEPVIQANLTYLIDTGLIYGTKRYSDNGQAWAIPTEISPSGIDLVNSNRDPSSKLQKGETTNEKLDKIQKMLEKNTNLQKGIASILLRMNERDCNREEL